LFIQLFRYDAADCRTPLAFSEVGEIRMKSLQVLFSLVMLGLAFVSHTKPSTAAVQISNDRGGEVIVYALRVLKLKRAGSFVAITGRCASACTLHLALPTSKMCVGRNVSFAFHLPYGSSERSNRVAASYLMRSYPNWVRRWIAAQGGLSSRMITMEYAYASRFLPTCNPRQA
jgi:hypothetical protein